MITISLCMIVKNEEPVLARCLDSVASMMDEIIIVDTGSTDRTKEIAAQYTSRIYDFTWCDDFSAARNYAFSLATMDYIYCPDADEYLDLENQRRFLRLKGALLPEIEIVQMNYITPPDFNTVQNCKKSHVQNFLNACARFHGSIRFTKRSAPIPSSMTVILIFCTTHIPCMPSGILPCLKKHFVKIMSSRRKSRACMQENFINVGMRKIFYARRIIFRYTMKHTLMQNPRVFWHTLPVSKILWMISFRSV